MQYDIPLHVPVLFELGEVNLCGIVVDYTPKKDWDRGVWLWPYGGYEVNIVTYSGQSQAFPAVTTGKASDSSWDWEGFYLKRDQIIGWKLLDKVDLPLLIGMSYKSPLLEKLLKEI